MNFPLLSVHIPEGTSHRFIQQGAGCQKCECVVSKEEKVPKIMRRGKTLWSKKHFDAIQARRTHDESSTEWYSVQDMPQ